MENISKKLGRYGKDLSHLRTTKKSEYKKLNERYLSLYFSTKNPIYRDRLIETNLPMVAQIVGQYFISLDAENFRDLIQEGNISLIKYIDRYIGNEKNGGKDVSMFSKYMYITIQDSILSYHASNMKSDDCMPDISTITEAQQADDEDLEDKVLSQVDSRVNKKIISRVILQKNSREYNILTTFVDNIVGNLGSNTFVIDLAMKYEVSTEAIRQSFGRSKKKIRDAVKYDIIEKEQVLALLEE